MLVGLVLRLVRLGRGCEGARGLSGRDRCANGQIGRYEGGCGLWSLRRGQRGCCDGGRVLG